MQFLSSTPGRRAGRGRRHVRGIVLLDTMLAAVVMAFTLTTAITAMQRAFLMLDTSRNLTVGSQILQTAVEQTTMMAWRDVAEFPASATLPIDATFTNYAKVRDRFTLTREVKKIRGNNELLEITFTLRWSNITGAHTRTYTLYYSRYGSFDYV